MDLHKLFDDAAHGAAPPSEEQARTPQVRMAPAKQGPADERLILLEVGHIAGFNRARDRIRLEELQRDEAMQEAKDQKRKAAAMAAAEKRQAELDERKRREKAESLVRRERWRAEDGK
jgi:hypothetical protein